MPKKIISQLIRMYLFWIVFFAIGRIIFLSYNFYDWSNAGVIELLSTFIYSLYLDTTTACFFLIIPFVLLVMQSLLNLHLFNIIHKYYHYILIILTSIIALVEPALYYEWRTKLTDKALGHLFNSPSEVFKTATNFTIVGGVLGMILLIGLGIYLFNKFFFKNIDSKRRNYWFSLAFFVLTPPLIFIGMRGGVQPIPITQSDVYFSKSHNILNLAAVNSVWNIGHSYSSNRAYLNSNPYQYLSTDEAKKNTSNLYLPQKDTTITIIEGDKPNIVFIILESWSSDLVGVIGGDSTVTPEFNKLSEEGILFTKFVSGGDRSDQSMACIFSAFPSQPTTSIVDIQSKQRNLPFLMKDFEKHGYSSSFHFGGDLSYGNIAGYMYQHEVDIIVEQKDYPLNTPAGKLGIHDDLTFKRFQKDLKERKEPFFASYFSLSTHAPYDMPMEEVIHHGGREKEYLNSMYFADKELGKFIKEAKKTDWYKNSIVFIMADHSHITPKHNPYHSWRHHHIPALIIGGALKDSVRGTRYEKWATHADFAKTLFKQFGYKEGDNYPYSRNLFNPYEKNFVYYSFNDGVGFLSDSAHIAWEHRTQKYIYNEFEGDWTEEQKVAFRNTGKGYLQTVFQDYIDIDGIGKR